MAIAAVNNSDFEAYLKRIGKGELVTQNNPTPEPNPSEGFRSMDQSAWNYVPGGFNNPNIQAPEENVAVEGAGSYTGVGVVTSSEPVNDVFVPEDNPDIGAITTVSVEPTETSSAVVAPTGTEDSNPGGTALDQQVADYYQEFLEETREPEPGPEEGVGEPSPTGEATFTTSNGPADGVDGEPPVEGAPEPPVGGEEPPIGTPSGEDGNPAGDVVPETDPSNSGEPALIKQEEHRIEDEEQRKIEEAKRQERLEEGES